MAWNAEAAGAFAATLKEARQHARLTQRQLATLSGISHTTVARLESAGEGGRSRPVRPGAETVRALARGLATQPDSSVSQRGESSFYADLMAAAGYPTRLSPTDPAMREVIERETYEIENDIGRLCDALKMRVLVRDLDWRDLNLLHDILKAMYERLDPSDIASSASRGTGEST